MTVRPLALAVCLLAVLPACASAKSKQLQTPGYKGVTKAPKLLPQEAPTPVALGSGTDPQVLVDAAGTAHVVWNEDRGANEDVTHYCRLKRGATRCDASASLIPPLDTSDPGNSPNANRDFDGPRVVALGDEVGILTQRSFRTVAPDGQPSQSNTFLFLSQDGGTTFNPPSLVGTGPLSGQQAVYGAADAPRVGLISDTATGGPFFQALTPGQFNRRQVSFGGDGIEASVARAGDLPIVAYRNLSGTTFVKTWSGQGDIYDAQTWSTATLPNADDPLLASGPAGPFLMYARGKGSPADYVVSRVTPPATVGTPVRVTNAPGRSRRDFFQSDSGGLLASFVDGSGDVARLVTRRSADGRSWTSPVALLQATRSLDVWSSDIAAAFDGGGFAVGQIAAGGAEGPIVAARFGEGAATGRPGLGSLAGGAADPTIVERCQRVEFAAVDIETPEGCLLSAADKKGVKVSEGTIKLNGLELVPSNGVKILLNARERTIDSTGPVKIQARAPGSDPVVLAEDEIHIRLGGGSAPAGSQCKGDILVGFDAGKAILKGFPIRGRIEIYLEPDSACIPVSLELPKAFGGIRGDAVIRTSNARGLHLESLDIQANTIPIGPILIRDLRITYKAAGERWTGGALITFPPGATLGATVVFSNGEFRGATITVGFHPGIPLFAGVFLNRITAGLEVDPLKLTAGVRVGAFPLPAVDAFALAVNGRLEATFGDPFVLQVNGDVSIFGFQFLSAEAIIRSDLYFSIKARLNLDFKVVSVRGDAAIWIDGPREEFGGSVSAAVSVFGFKIASASAVLSSKAMGICGPSPVPFVDAGFVVVWGKGIEPLWGDCDLEEYGPTTSGRWARAAQAGTLSVPSGTPSAGLRVTGAGGVPSLVITSPSGERIVPAKTGGTAVLAESPEDGVAYVALPKPAAGAWRVEAAPGSVPIAKVESALAKADPKVSGSVDRTRTLRWKFPNADGRTLAFVEKGAGGERMIGAGSGTSGTLRIAPGEGAGGKRTISAVVSQDGTPRRRIQIASYTAPPPARPSRVGKPKARRVKGAVSVSWGTAPGASAYVVRADVSDGRRLAFFTTKRSLRVPNVTKAEKVVIRVQGRNAKGRLGPALTVRPR